MSDIKQLGAVLSLLNRAWIPHKGQVEVGKAVFNSPADLVYVECGRKFGKSEFGVYCCWLYALTHPNAEVYYLAPAVKQAKELVWSNNRMQTCNTYDEWFVKALESELGITVKIYYHEMRIMLSNGSFIKIDGSDNYNAQRGLKPDLIAADEYRDFKKEWIEAVRPNMSVKSGKILFITTPPHSPNHAYEMAEECRNGMLSGDKHYFYLNLPSNCNDRIPNHTEWLAREKARLLGSDRENEWRREYMAEFISSSEHAVIPQLNRDILMPHDDVLERLKGRQGLELYTLLDPGNSSVFSAMVAVFDPFSAELWVLWTMQDRNSNTASITHAWPQIEEVYKFHEKELNCELKGIYYNPRTPWINHDLHDLVGRFGSPMPRDLKDPMHNLTLIKDVCSAGKMYVSERAKLLVTEAELYQRSKETLKIPKDEQPLINCLRYLLTASAYTIDMLDQPPQKTAEEMFYERLEDMEMPDDDEFTIF